VPRFVLTAFAAALGTLTGPARLPAAEPPPDTTALTAVLRDLLLKNLPDPLVRTSHDWGRQAETTVGWTVRRSGPLRWDTEPRKAMRNDGHWHRLTVVAKDPPRTLALGIKDVVAPEDGKLTFVAHVGADVDLRFEQQLWKGGLRVYSGETRARCRAAVRLTCESTSRFDRKPGAVLPDAVLRVRVTAAEVFYDGLVVEHTLGVGGDAARLLGEAAHRLMKQLKPSLERDLLAKANAAVVKAGDTKDVRVEFAKLLAGKTPARPTK
jgi:hypothetical protein